MKLDIDYNNTNVNLLLYKNKYLIKLWLYLFYHLVKLYIYKMATCLL